MIEAVTSEPVHQIPRSGRGFARPAAIEKIVFAAIAQCGGGEAGAGCPCDLEQRGGIAQKHIYGDAFEEAMMGAVWIGVMSSRSAACLSAISISAFWIWRSSPSRETDFQEPPDRSGARRTTTIEEFRTGTTRYASNHPVFYWRCWSIWRWGTVPGIRKGGRAARVVLVSQYLSDRQCASRC